MTLDENEWQMQARLTPHWTEHGAHINGEQVFLAAWEVMTTWAINDFSKSWAHPSIDFLFLNRRGEIWLVEMKREVKSPKDAWSSLCQVTHRVVALKRGYSFENLCAAHTACWSGAHGRVSESKPDKLQIAHQNHFSLSEPLTAEQFGRGEWGRIVAAKAFHKNWDTTLGQFADEELAALKATLRSKYKLESKGNLDLRRFVDEVTPESWGAMQSKPAKWTLEED